LRLTIIVLITVLVVGGSIIAYGFFTNPDTIETEQTSAYEKLDNYRTELEKINQYNQKVLSDLEQKITNSDNANLEQLNKEIEVLKRVIKDNTAELEQVIEKLSKMEPNP
jgi:peptidoglycan hydrolase CwlO-like protein